jgi:hypothetical protein
VISRDVDRYSTLLRLVASLSRLFSDNDSPYVDSRFVERLYVQTTGAVDLGRKDISFDAKFNDVGIGVKTFLAGSGNSKREKVAEFTAYARDGRFIGLSKRDLVHEVVRARNERVTSDANEYGIDLRKSIYHCLIRMPGGAVVHEEPYGTILEDSLNPTNSVGEIVGSWDEMGNGIYFTDGINNYSYSTAKNVLMKQFVFERDLNFIPIEVLPDPLGGLEERFAMQSTSKTSDTSSSSNFVAKVLTAEGTSDAEELIPGVDYVVLPLYRMSGQEKEVPTKSGVNQWNAAGRDRKLGESYVPIPRVIHERFPGFFPGRDVSFMLKLPNQQEFVQAKVCQDGSKALMTKPNYLLGEWLIGVIRPSLGKEMFQSAPRNLSPITYADFIKVGKDSVRIVKQLDSDTPCFQIQFEPVDSFEEFISKNLDLSFEER